jgi:hypothetical protein
MFLLEPYFIFVLLYDFLRCLPRLLLNHISFFAFVDFSFASLYLYEEFRLDGIVIFGVHFFHFEFLGLLAKEIVMMWSRTEGKLCLFTYLFQDNLHFFLYFSALFDILFRNLLLDSFGNRHHVKYIYLKL